MGALPQTLVSPAAIEVANNSLAHAAKIWNERAPVSPNPKIVDIQQAIGQFVWQHDASPLHDYLSAMPLESYKSPIGILAAIHQSHKLMAPLAVVSHERLLDPSAHIEDELLWHFTNQLPREMFFAHPAIVKTITVVVHESIGYKHIVVTELSDVTIDNHTLHAISEATGISRRRLKDHSHINCRLFDPIEKLGQEPGNVGPFSHFVDAVDHFVYRGIAEPPFVAVRFTPFDTVCMTSDVFEAIAFAHLQSLGHRYLCI